MPAEIIALEEYRRALGICASRDARRRWIGMRFWHLEDMEYFMIPPACGGNELIYLKLYGNVAAIWGSYNGCAWPQAVGQEHATLLFHLDMPVLPCVFDFTPPG